MFREKPSGLGSEQVMAMIDRPGALWNNLRGVERLTAIGYNIGLDMAKLVYELRGNYTR